MLKPLLRYAVVTILAAGLGAATARAAVPPAPKPVEQSALPTGFTRSDTANGTFLTAHGATANGAVSLSPDGRVCVGLLTLDGTTVLIRCEPNP